MPLDGTGWMDTRDRMIAALTAGLHPSRLEVIDESHLHAGHSGARPGGQTHYRVRIASARFAGETRLACHRMVNALLANELAAGVHALAIEIER